MTSAARKDPRTHSTGDSHRRLTEAELTAIWQWANGGAKPYKKGTLRQLVKKLILAIEDTQRDFAARELDAFAAHWFEKGDTSHHAMHVVNSAHKWARELRDAERKV